MQEEIFLWSGEEDARRWFDSELIVVGLVTMLLILGLTMILTTVERECGLDVILVTFDAVTTTTVKAIKNSMMAALYDERAGDMELNGDFMLWVGDFVLLLELCYWNNKCWVMKDARWQPYFIHKISHQIICSFPWRPRGSIVGVDQWPVGAEDLIFNEALW